MTDGMSSPPRLVLAAPVRTPIGRFGGALASLSAADLGTAAAKAALARAGLDAGAVDQVVFGHARQAGGGPNTARQIAFRSGVPQERPAFTVNQACGSGLQAVLCAARAIRLGEADVVLAGGTESMSNTPYLLPRARWGYRLGHAEIVDGMYQDGFNDPLSKLVMGETAEELAVEAGIDRAAADEYAAESATPLRGSAARRPLRRRDRARRGARQGRRYRGRPRRASARRRHRRLARQARPGVPRGRHGHRRQRLRHHRRRRGAGGGLGSRRGTSRAHPRRLPARLGGGRRRPAHHGHRPGARRAPAASRARASTTARSTRSSSTRPSPARCSPA